MGLCPNDYSLLAHFSSSLTFSVTLEAPLLTMNHNATELAGVDCTVIPEMTTFFHASPEDPQHPTIGQGPTEQTRVSIVLPYNMS